MMKKITLLITLMLFQVSYGLWQNLNTGIQDNLTGVVFVQNSGLVSGVSLYLEDAKSAVKIFDN